MTDQTNLTTTPLTTERWPDLVRLFESKGCAFARGCWCMDFRIGRTPARPVAVDPKDYKRQQLQALADHEPSPGLLGYRAGKPVGWVSVAPRRSYAALSRSRVMAPVDATEVWSIICFVVPAEFRRQGIASALLQEAISYARGEGSSMLEAYPIDSPTARNPNWLWHGTRGMFENHGFVEVARRKETRPIMRLALQPC